MRLQFTDGMGRVAHLLMGCDTHIFRITGHSQGQNLASAATAQQQKKTNDFESMRPWKAFCGLHPFVRIINGSHKALVRGVNSAINFTTQHGDDLTRYDYAFDHGHFA